MKVNYIGILAGIIAFISLLLPWWVVTMSTKAMGIELSVGISVNLHQATASAMGMSSTANIDLWYGWAALAFIVITGIAAIVGSLIIGKTGKMILIVAGILALLSMIIFVVGLQGEISKAPLLPGYPTLGIFSSGSWEYSGVNMNYSSYLTFGFWLALVATILAFISLLKHPATPLPASPPTIPTPES